MTSQIQLGDSMDLDESLIYLGSEQEQSPIDGVIQRMTNIFRGLPRDMFVNKVIQCYRSSERLESIRADLFEYLKGYDEFPYGAGVELKRRVQTRAGDPLVSKLAKDIYTLVSVIEGAEYAELTDLMSLSRHGKSTRSVSSFQTQNTCNCDAEIKSLKDTVAMLTADIVLLKQNLAADELRFEQSKTVKQSVCNLKSDINGLKVKINSSFSEIRTVIDKFQCEKLNGITSLKVNLNVYLRKLRVVKSRYK